MGGREMKIMRGLRGKGMKAQTKEEKSVSGKRNRKQDEKQKTNTSLIGGTVDSIWFP